MGLTQNGQNPKPQKRRYFEIGYKWRKGLYELHGAQGEVDGKKSCMSYMEKGVGRNGWIDLWTQERHHDVS